MNKLTRAEDFVEQRDKYRREGKTVVWTNGCFDLVHAGHALSLQAAKALGDVLVVGLNTDESVRELKGPERPLINLDSRAKLLCEFESVDHVIPFSGKRCTPELKIVKPDIYAQGSDYTLETIDQGERAAVENAGGKITFLPFIDGVSTSLILKKIRRSDPEKITSAAFALLRNEKGQLLLVANRYLEGIRWGLPGGGHERGETLRQAIVRECREEIGVDFDGGVYRGVIERIEPALGLHLVLHLFEAELSGNAVEIASQDEDVVDARWFDCKALRETPGWILGREHWITYLQNPAAFPAYIFMGPGEE
jgi:rfaE bifunctional protein nucleotidyltransferase chain/domain